MHKDLEYHKREGELERTVVQPQEIAKEPAGGVFLLGNAAQRDLLELEETDNATDRRNKLEHSRMTIERYSE